MLFDTITQVSVDGFQDGKENRLTNGEQITFILDGKMTATL